MLYQDSASTGTKFSTSMLVTSWHSEVATDYVDVRVGPALIGILVQLDIFVYDRPMSSLLMTHSLMFSVLCIANFDTFKHYKTCARNSGCSSVPVRPY